MSAVGRLRWSEQTCVSVARVQPAVIDALGSHLSALAELLAGIDGETYRAAPIRTSGSIGEHVRHCLDHIRALVSAARQYRLTYDARLRGTSVETDPGAALHEIGRLGDDLQRIDEADLEHPIELLTLTHRNAPPSLVRSTLGREAAFVIQHTIHHCALIAALLDRIGVAAPPRFGYAPSTPGQR